jgi:alpha-glucosidase
LGDKSGFLNKRCYEYENWNSDLPQAHTEDFHALYKSVPFLMCKKKQGVYGLFFDNTFHSYFNLGKECSDYFLYAADDGNLDYYFLGGEHLTDVIGNYTYLTGTTPLPQLWSLGYHQCRWGYECAEDIREVAQMYRKLQIPCESVQYDIDYMEQYKVFTWDEAHYGKKGELFAELGKTGFKPVVIIDPGTKLEPGYFMYEEGMKHGYFAKDKDGEVYVNEVWPGEATYPDFGRKEVRDWWGEHISLLTDMGVLGIWNDMNEPASFKGPLPDDVVFCDEERVTNHAELHNVYGHFMGQATYEGYKKHTGKRPFVITRAAYAGTQKYACVWTGDNQSLWAHLQMLIPQLCNLGMSGFSLCGTDIGGFGADTTPELMSRWVEAAMFSPFFRNHSAKGTRRQEPWMLGEQVVEIYRKYVGLRYQFLPYLYDLLYQGERTGLPVMRPLVLHYEDDENTHNLNNEFLVGEQLLVAPVVEQGATRRMIYLPKGTWYDFWTKEKVEGGTYILREAAIDVCPMYVRAGSIIPMYEAVQYVGEKPYEKLILLTTPGACVYEHFCDDGESYAYKEGAYTLYRFSKSDKGSVTTKLLRDGYGQYRQIEEKPLEP